MSLKYRSNAMQHTENFYSSSSSSSSLLFRSFSSLNSIHFHGTRNRLASLSITKSKKRDKKHEQTQTSIEQQQLRLYFIWNCLFASGVGSCCCCRRCCGLISILWWRDADPLECDVDNGIEWFANNLYAKRFLRWIDAVSTSFSFQLPAQCPRIYAYAHLAIPHSRLCVSAISLTRYRENCLNVGSRNVWPISIWKKKK